MNPQPAPDLPAIQANVLAGLLSGQGVAAVARENNIHRSTIYNWQRQNTRFAYTINQARSRHNEVIFDGLQDIAEQAVETLRHLVTSDTVAPSVRLRAVQTVLKGVNAAQPQPRLKEDLAIEALCDALEPRSAVRQPTQIDTSRQISTVSTNRPAPAPRLPITPITSTKVGRNEPCPCGSGLKYKRCCGNPVSTQAAAA